MIGHLIADAKAELNLNTMQQGMFDTAVANSKAAHETGPCAARRRSGTTLQTELAKPEPDLAAVAAAADAAMEEGRAAAEVDPRPNGWRSTRQFSPEQKAVVRDLLQKRMNHADSFRQKMRERMHHFRDGATG